MSKNLRKSAIELRDYLASIPVGQYEKKKAEIIAACKIKPHTLGNWKQGVRIGELYKDKIEEVAGRKIFSREDD